MNAYCDRQSQDSSAIAFLFDGRRLRAEQTPDEVCVYNISSSFCFYRLCSNRSNIRVIYFVAAGNGRWG